MTTEWAFRKVFPAVLPGMAHFEMHARVSNILKTVTLTEVGNNTCLQFFTEPVQLFHCQTSHLTPVCNTLFDDINNIR
jgi:hypothetical protein